jgi:serine phosphatase RsbU (regulator of sigma subunit)
MLTVFLAVFHLGMGEHAWSRVRHMVFDAYQRRFPRPVTPHPVTIIDIDEPSLATFGRWPWPRTLLAELLAATHRLGALAIGLDIIMPEADSQSPELLLATRPDISAEVRQVLAQLPSNDTLLAQTLQRIPVVVARAGIPLAKPAVSSQTSALILGEAPLAHVPAYSGHLTNMPELEAAARGRGYLNDTRDPDGVVRTMPLVFAINGEFAPSLALELLRVATPANWYSVHGSPGGVQGVQIDNRFIPTTLNGGLRLYFSPALSGRRVSARAILQGEIGPGALAQQVAIVGVTGTGVADVVTTPVATRMDGVEVQAQVIENILERAWLHRPSLAHWWELLTFLGGALLLIVCLPRLRPGAGVGITLMLVGMVWGGSLVAFSQARLLYDPSLPTIGSGLLLVILLTAGFAAADRQRRQLNAALEVARAEQLRIAGELQAAREIQRGMLPTPEDIARFPANLEFHAILKPAEEVGGDLYDAFMLDPEHFFFLIGDVSGKGVPAALFMALSMTLCESLGRRTQMSLDALIRLINEEISHKNQAALFLTAIIGIIDIRSGEMALCNAGHDAPILLRANQSPGLLTSASGPPFCVLEDFPYTFDRIQLQANDILVLLTDGVTEAEDTSQNFYGLARTLAYFTDAPPLGSAVAACDGLYQDVQRFVDDARPSDDITIMAIRFTKPQ